MEWYSKYLQVYEKPFAEAPQAVIEEVRRNLAGLQSNEPLVTVSLIGYNEEKHLLACLWSVSYTHLDVYKRQVLLHLQCNKSL